MEIIKKGIFTNNQLKIMALVFMTCDHIAKAFFPQSAVLLILGRLAYPIFAYMIAEGCIYTKNRVRHLLMLGGLAVICQLVFTLFTGSYVMCILITFTLSVILIYTYDNMINRKSALDTIIFVALLAGVVFLCVKMPDILPGFMIDYGLIGVIIPLTLYMLKGKIYKLICLAVLLLMMGFQLKGYQFYALISVVLLFLYNGERGKLNLKYLFYIYYPVHLVIIYIIQMLTVK